MDKPKKTLSPAQELTRRIINRLTEKKLLAKEEALKNELKVAEGKMQSSDWKLAFEKSLGLHKKP
jgi:hypothetical protein